MRLCDDNSDVPIRNLCDGAPVVQSFPGQRRMGVVKLPDIPADVLDLALSAAACGSPQSSLWLDAYARLGSELTPSQWADLAIWATKLMPDFGLPSEMHCGLFQHHNDDALLARLGVYDVTPWSYAIRVWSTEDGSLCCIVAIQRSFLKAEARVSEIYFIDDSDHDNSDYKRMVSHLGKRRLIERLLGVTVSQRRCLGPDDRVGATWQPIPCQELRPSVP